MRALLWLLAGIVASTLAGSAVTVLVGQAIRAQEELILVFFLVPIVALIAAFSLEVALQLARRRGVIDGVGVALVLLVVAGVLALWAFVAAWSSGRAQAVARTDLLYMLAIGLPCLATILVQWWLVRRRWPRDGHA